MTTAAYPCIDAVSLTFAPWATRAALPWAKHEYRIAAARHRNAVRKGVAAPIVAMWARDKAEAKSRITAILSEAPFWADRDGDIYDGNHCVVAEALQRPYIRLVAGTYPTADW